MGGLLALRRRRCVKHALTFTDVKRRFSTCGRRRKRLHGTFHDPNDPIAGRIRHAPGMHFCDWTILFL